MCVCVCVCVCVYVCVCVCASYTYARIRTHIQGYMGVVLHFIQSDKGINTISRAAVALRAQCTHTIEDWHQCLTDVASKFNTHFETVTTDGASEFTSPKFLSPDPQSGHVSHVRTRLPCFAHAWELGVSAALRHVEYRDALEDFAWITGRLRAPHQRMALLNEAAKSGGSLQSTMLSRCVPVRALYDDREYNRVLYTGGWGDDRVSGLKEKCKSLPNFIRPCPTRWSHVLRQLNQLFGDVGGQVHFYLLNRCTCPYPSSSVTQYFVSTHAVRG